MSWGLTVTLPLRVSINCSRAPGPAHAPLPDIPAPWHHGSLVAMQPGIRAQYVSGRLPRPEHLSGVLMQGAGGARGTAVGCGMHLTGKNKGVPGRHHKDMTASGSMPHTYASGPHKRPGRAKIRNTVL